MTARQARRPDRPAAAHQVWLRTREVRRLTGWSEGHIRRLGREKRLAARLSASRGRNGKREREYDLCSLSAAAQTKFLKTRRSLWRWFVEYQKHGFAELLQRIRKACRG
jgi:hypothetical protein